jgi:hypothetical protein
MKGWLRIEEMSEKSRQDQVLDQLGGSLPYFGVLSDDNLKLFQDDE